MGICSNDFGVANVPKHDIKEFAETYMNLKRKGIFKSKTDVDKLLSHKKTLISKPLMSLQSALHQDAVQMFKNVVSYMGDRDSNKEGENHAKKLIKVRRDNLERFFLHPYVVGFELCISLLFCFYYIYILQNKKHGTKEKRRTRRRRKNKRGLLLPL